MFSMGCHSGRIKSGLNESACEYDSVFSLLKIPNAFLFFPESWKATNSQILGRESGDS